MGILQLRLSDHAKGLDRIPNIKTLKWLDEWVGVSGLEFPQNMAAKHRFKVGYVRQSDAD